MRLKPLADFVLDPEGSMTAKVYWFRECAGAGEFVNLCARIRDALNDAFNF